MLSLPAYFLCVKFFQGACVNDVTQGRKEGKKEITYNLIFFGYLDSLREILCVEKERPHVPYERAVMAIRFNEHMIGTQFLPANAGIYFPRGCFCFPTDYPVRRWKYKYDKKYLVPAPTAAHQIRPVEVVYDVGRSNDEEFPEDIAFPGWPARCKDPE